MAHAKRILTIAPGTPFLKTLAQSLCAGTLASGFSYDPADPLSLARVTIYVPTRRSARVLRSEFVDILGGRSAILPVIRPLGETDDDSGYFDIETPATIDLAPPISSTARLVELARLILAWRNSLPDAIRAIHSDSPLVAPASPADAIWLARALSEVIDAMDTEDKDWEALSELDTADHAQWWQLTAKFPGDRQYLLARPPCRTQPVFRRPPPQRHPSRRGGPADEDREHGSDHRCRLHWLHSGCRRSDCCRRLFAARHRRASRS